MTSLQDYFDALHRHFLLWARGLCRACGGHGRGDGGRCPECDGAGHRNQSLQPWEHSDSADLVAHVARLARAVAVSGDSGRIRPDLLVDLTLAAAFLWLQQKDRDKLPPAAE